MTLMKISALFAVLLTMSTAHAATIITETFSMNASVVIPDKTCQEYYF